MLIADRSGSMSGLLPKLIDDICQVLRSTPAGDYISFGWFSSQGEFRFPVKGFKINTDADRKALNDMLQQFKFTLGLTCFSEILTDADTVREEVEAITQVTSHSLWFFTDGCPVVRNYSQELSAIQKALDPIPHVFYLPNNSRQDS